MPTVGSPPYTVTGHSNVQRFIRSDTAMQWWIKPKGAEWVWVRVVGCGGAGGGYIAPAGAVNPAYGQAGGGGAGGFVEMVYAASQLPDTVGITVGTPGAPVLAAAGGAGGDVIWGADIGSGAAYYLAGLGGGGGTAVTGDDAAATAAAGGAGGSFTAGSLGYTLASDGENGRYGRTIYTGGAGATFIYNGQGGRSLISTSPDPGDSYNADADSGRLYGGGGTGALGRDTNAPGVMGGSGAVGGVFVVTRVRF